MSQRLSSRMTAGLPRVTGLEWFASPLPFWSRQAANDGHIEYIFPAHESVLHIPSQVLIAPLHGSLCCFTILSLLLFRLRHCNMILPWVTTCLWAASVHGAALGKHMNLCCCCYGAHRSCRSLCSTSRSHRCPCATSVNSHLQQTPATRSQCDSRRNWLLAQ